MDSYSQYVEVDQLVIQERSTSMTPIQSLVKFNRSSLVTSQFNRSSSERDLSIGPVQSSDLSIGPLRD